MGKEKKEKKEKKEAEVATPVGTEERVFVRPTKLAPIAKPLADDKLCKKVLKLAKKAAKKKQIKRGVKEVVKALRKNVTGVCIIAGDISPIDVVTHLPVLCEDRDIPYIYVPSKEELGAAGLTKRPTSCMLVMPKPVKGTAEGDDAKEFAEAYTEVAKKVKAAQPVF
ncbi:hypothetical protein WJX72_006706 [[Myrmecia] bisecta]|uniref:H/ACA ribonucleoprotein complex subunit 2 n=1 Tax=[Myrmecia] bisecta TaxID=41462 RepID=A0AAW1QR96_9CHLO